MAKESQMEEARGLYRDITSVGSIINRDCMERIKRGMASADELFPLMQDENSALCMEINTKIKELLKLCNKAKNVQEDDILK